VSLRQAGRRSKLSRARPEAGAGSPLGAVGYSLGSTDSLSSASIGEHALVHAAERLAGDEAAERLHAQGELAQRQRAFRREAALAQTADLIRGRVLGSVDDAQILAATALHGRLRDTAGAARDELLRFHDHAFAACVAREGHLQTV
jgi:hypothetical protein